MTDSLSKLIAAERDAIEFGFDWSNYSSVLDQIKAEYDEVSHAIKNESPIRIREEVSDVIHSAISLCIFMDFDVDEIIDIAAQKYTKHIDALKNIAHRKGLSNLRGQSIEYMFQLWHEVKLNKPVQLDK